VCIAVSIAAGMSLRALLTRANAAVVVEKQRAKLAMTWDELIIPADEEKARAAGRFSRETHHE
jgi:hypothetical protein